MRLCLRNGQLLQDRVCLGHIAVALPLSVANDSSMSGTHKVL